ncbi:PQQ-like beta-propeller repeat protein [Jannaschia seohaensis]|uniref:Outer membrane protein assembly factor BamB n=1 Tax=Jannaschia seohaensis TaxID=475081 RepID=A0A2Y9ABC9_9RHOB|nr:PQQ-like beta-propeller repeat protein [Jannaschia seohaensis]PWJ21170.1 outer membrane protein assembly factor BamB [Jannaschia seohaensis]SSA41580.1 Outer membrane protein assembly factor BamB, contains PQQ-like beta-propeller repeat [Jannaschia seohaensis]
MTLRTGFLLATAALALAACAEKEEILPGERLAVRPGEVGSVLAEAAQDVSSELVPLTLAPPQRLDAWPMRVGNAANDPPHATLAAEPGRVWTADIGAGDSRRLRIAADPVSDGSRIFTMDAQSGVAATTLAGERVWSRALVPVTENASDAAGGGLAAVDGTLYATTGFGELHALDAATGERRWVQELDAPLTTPKVAGGLVYVVSRDNRAWAIEADTGRIRWDIPAGPSEAAMATAPAPALTDRLVIFPFASGEVIAALRQSGIRVWGSSVAGQRRGVASGFVGDITGDPVVADGSVYAGTTSGRLVALERASGLRRWTADDGAVSPVVAAGGSIFAVTDRAQLVRLQAETGEVIWRTDLPFYRSIRLRRREGVFVHYGPVLAGGRLWVASSDGALRGFDPETGELAAQAEVPGGAASRPIALGDALYVVGRNGELHAFR